MTAQQSQEEEKQTDFTSSFQLGVEHIVKFYELRVNSRNLKQGIVVTIDSQKGRIFSGFVPASLMPLELWLKCRQEKYPGTDKPYYVARLAEIDLGARRLKFEILRETPDPDSFFPKSRRRQ